MTTNNPARRGLYLLAAGMCVLFVTSQVRAAERHHGAHEHGVSEAKLAVDGKIVEIEMHSPGADIVGFEHAAESDADKAAVARAADMLAKGAGIFVPVAAARCRLIDADIDAPGMEAGHHDHDDKHLDDKHHGKKGHAHGHGHSHGHGHKDHDDAKAEKHVEDGHSEFRAHYRFRCANADKLTHIDVKLFEKFPRARELRVQAVTGTGQFVRELKPGSARLAF